MMVSFVLSFFPRDVLDEILNLIESVSEDFPSYSKDFLNIGLNTGAISLLSSFSRIGLISSGPAALSGFKFAKSLRIPFKSISIAGRPKAALLFWCFGDFRCGVSLFIVIDPSNRPRVISCTLFWSPGQGMTRGRFEGSGERACAQFAPNWIQH